MIINYTAYDVYESLERKEKSKIVKMKKDRGRERERRRGRKESMQ